MKQEIARHTACDVQDYLFVQTMVGRRKVLENVVFLLISLPTPTLNTSAFIYFFSTWSTICLAQKRKTIHFHLHVPENLSNKCRKFKMVKPRVVSGHFALHIFMKGSALLCIIRRYDEHKHGLFNGTSWLPEILIPT